MLGKLECGIANCRRVINEIGFEQALLWVLSYSDGAHDLLSIAERSRLGFARIAQAAAALEQAGLARDIDEVGAGSLQ